MRSPQTLCTMRERALTTASARAAGTPISASDDDDDDFVFFWPVPFGLQKVTNYKCLECSCECAECQCST